MIGLLLLIAATTFYAGYNLLVRVSGSYVPIEATTTIAATICLQLAALATSILFASTLLVRGGHVFHLTPGAYLWAVAAGFCIGGAEIAYFYLFSGIGGEKPMAASIAIPVVVGGTILISLVVAFFLFGEALSWKQALGGACIIFGILFLFSGKSAA